MKTSKSSGRFISRHKLVSQLSRRFILRGVLAMGILLFLTTAFNTFAADNSPLGTADSGQIFTIEGLGSVTVHPGKIQSSLELASSSIQFTNIFNWAKAQALAFAFDNGDPVGPWDEAVEPGREGFCVRDTCHQALGAQALGLARFNLNMLQHFAGDISDSKDWCSYWEINRFNKPCPVDYQDDTAFWYNLPSNFDLLDTCYRMYVWTGDMTYINDPVFLKFYDRTVNDYVNRWALGVDQVMTRPRLLNVRGILTTNRFQHSRGIPGYNEGDHTYVIAFDTLITERAAFLADAHIQQVRQNVELSQELLGEAAAMENLITNVWWDNSNQCYYGRLSADYQLEGSGRRNRSLSGDWHLDVTGDSGGFSRPDDADVSMKRLLDLSHARLSYPEVSFTRIGDIVRDAFGVNLDFDSPLNSRVEGGWVEVTVQTLSGLGTTVDWAELRNLPIRANVVTIRHDGMSKTTLTSQTGPALWWQPGFRGEHDTLLVNGKPVKAKIEMDNAGQVTSSTRIQVGAGETFTAEVAK